MSNKVCKESLETNDKIIKNRHFEPSNKEERERERERELPCPP